MSDLATNLERLGLEQYFDRFIGEAFDSWETLTDIQESDFDRLHVKLGHRRKLQRAFAEYRGVSFDRFFGSVSQEAPPDGGRGSESGIAGSTDTERQAGPPTETKRKYRRHPKVDENAPERPPSAYVIFSNKVREEVKDQNLSFTQIAKLVGDRWQKVDPAGKEPYELQASMAKDRYNIQLSAYRKTEEYKEYVAYLADFKAKHGPPAEAKRPKLEAESSGSIISAKSLELGQEGAQSSSSHFRGSSMGSSGSSPFISSMAQSSSGGAPVPPRPTLPSSRSGSSPSVQQSRDYFRPGLISGQSSLSEESPTVRGDVPDTVNRTAGLSIATSSSTPPLPSLPPSASSIDSPLPIDPLARSRLSYFVQQSQGSVFTQSLGNVQASPGPPPHHQNSPSATAQELNWRYRPTDFRNYPEPSRPQSSFPALGASREQATANQLVPMPSPEFYQAPNPRTLPPPRVLAGGISILPHLGRAMEQPRPQTTEALQMRQQGREDAQHLINRSESDAANALAGLASRRPRSDSTRSPDPNQRR